MKNFHLLVDEIFLSTVDKKNPSTGRWIFFINFGRRIKSRPQETCDRYTFAKLHDLPNEQCPACARQDWNGLGAIAL